MSIHEQITALLDGELVDAGSVGELMHVLAVSPEKRSLLVEQLALKRRYAASAASIVPPPSADLAIMRGLAAVDAGFAAAGPAAADVAAPVPTGATVALPRTILLATTALVMMLGAFGAGYLLRGDRVGQPVPDVAAMTTVVRDGASALAAARDSIALLSRQIDAARDESAAALADAGAARNESAVARADAGAARDEAVAARADAGAARTARDVATARAAATAPSASDVDRTNDGAGRTDGRDGLAVDRDVRASDRVARGIDRGSVRNATLAEGSDYLIPSHPRASGSDDLSTTGGGVTRPGRELATATESVLDEEVRGPIGLQLGIRNNFRLSLPRVYGLTKAPTALQDRELVGSIALGGEDDGLFSRLRAGAAFGQTQFSIVVHTNTGGAAIDTVYEMSPQPFYARGYLAPEILRVDRFAGLVELGGGYSSAGGFGTVGINLEYRPIEEIAIHGGASTWLLWSSFRGAVELSTNVNAHIGFMYGF